MPAKGGYTGRKDDLALDGRDVAARSDRPAEAALQRIPVARVEQLEEGSHGEKGSRDVEMQRLGHPLHGEVGEEGLAQLRKRMGWVEAHRRADCPRVGDHEVDIADLGGDVVDGGLEVLLGGHVALERSQAGVRLGGGLEHFQATSQDVDFSGAVECKGPGHGEANT